MVGDLIGLIQRAAEAEYQKLSWWKKHNGKFLIVGIILFIIAIGVFIGKFLL